MTARGRTFAALGAVLLATGRMFGVRELMMAGAGALAILIVGLVTVYLRGGTMRATRAVHPWRTTVGHDLRVTLTVRSRGRFGGGPALLSDRLSPGLGNQVRVSVPVGRDAHEVAYTVSPRQRGRHLIGPLELTQTDPFGAAQRTRLVSGVTAVTIYPAYDQVTTLPTGVQRMGLVKSSPLVGVGDEFYALRDYEQGDDPRKVHWPSSLKAGHLVVRQDELLAEPRLLIVCDTTRSKHRGRGATSSLEAAISACASIGALAIRRRMRLSVVTADGPLLTETRPDRDQFLEALATLSASDAKTITPALYRSDAHRASPAVMVVITPGLNATELRSVALIARNASAGAVVTIAADTYTRGSSRKRRRTAALTALSFPVVALERGDRFRDVWQLGVRDVAVAR